MNSLVTGATGFVGEHLLKKLVARGDKVRCLVRKTSDVTFLKQMGVELAEGDITIYNSVLDAAQGMDHVYHCAAQVGIGTAPRSQYYAVNVEGTGNVVRACERAGAGTLLYVSTQSVTFFPTARTSCEVPSTAAISTPRAWPHTASLPSDEKHIPLCSSDRMRHQRRPGKAVHLLVERE